MALKQYLRGETPYLEVKIFDQDGALVTPTSAKVTVIDPKGRVEIAYTAMTQVGSDTGIYYYASWTVASTQLAGIYKWICQITDGTIITKQTGEFEVLDYGTT